MPAERILTESARGKHHARSAAHSQSGLEFALVCLALALVAGTAAAFAWARPTATSKYLRYTQSGRLSYSGHVPAGSIYGSGLATGEPIYTSLVHNLEVGFTYQFSSGAPAVLSGTERLVATISNGQGITHPFVLSKPRSFHGDGSSMTGKLSLSALSAAANAFEKAAGASLEGGYTVTISPSVTVKGRLGPKPVSASFSPQFNFSYAGNALLPGTGTQGGSTTGTTANEGGAAPFTPSSSGSVTVPNARPANFLLPSLKVSTARVVFLVMFAVLAAAGALAGRRPFGEVTSEDESVRIASRYGPSLVEVATLPGFPSVVPVEISSIAGLVRVSRQLECPMLYCRGQGGRSTSVYAVLDNGTLYRYDVPRPTAVEAEARRAASLDAQHGQGLFIANNS